MASMEERERVKEKLLKRVNEDPDFAEFLMLKLREKFPELKPAYYNDKGHGLYIMDDVCRVLGMNKEDLLAIPGHEVLIAPLDPNKFHKVQ